MYFNYDGNQITKITDSWLSRNQYAVKEYQDKSNEPVESRYDANGNMTKDLDREIVTIKYNLLNLSDTIPVSTDMLNKEQMITLVPVWRDRQAGFIIPAAGCTYCIK